MNINSITDLANVLGTDVDHIKKYVYESTKCGAMISWDEDEIQIWATVKATGEEFGREPLPFTFDSDEYFMEIGWLEDTIAREERRANPDPELISEWIESIYNCPTMKKPTSYTAEDAERDLKVYRKHYFDDEYIDFQAVDPKTYTNLMNHFIRDIWKT